MVRRIFIRNVISVLTGSLLFSDSIAQDVIFSHNEVSRKEKITFGICTDIHNNIFPAAEKRLGKFIKEANKKKVDFIIQLGDFYYPKKVIRILLQPGTVLMVLNIMFWETMTWINIPKKKLSAFGDRI